MIECVQKDQIRYLRFFFWELLKLLDSAATLGQKAGPCIGWDQVNSLLMWSQKTLQCTLEAGALQALRKSIPFWAKEVQELILSINRESFRENLLIILKKTILFRNKIWMLRQVWRLYKNLYKNWSWQSEALWVCPYESCQFFTTFNHDWFMSFTLKALKLCTRYDALESLLSCMRQ